jgi:hypothetical protein
MPTLEAQEYDRFTFDEPIQRSLTLEEAVQKARDLRRNDSTNFYRVEQADESGVAFKVISIPVASVYADFMARVAKVTGRFARRVRHR